MSKTGIGAMYHILRGGSEHSPKEYKGLKIIAADFKDDHIKLAFDNKKIIEIWDSGQSCCESRYITTDDNVKSLIGQTLVSITVQEGADSEDDGECHETMFVKIQTNKDSATFCTHNEHNGYYGGFGLVITECPQKQKK